MEQMATFVRDGPFPSYYANDLGKVLSLMAAGVTLQLVDPTHIQLPASANDGAAVLSIMGQWRWVESTLGPIAAPGGGAGVYPVYAVAAANNISSTPSPYTDDTNYAFALQILAPGVTPTIVAGTVDIYRKIGNAHWNGTAITRVDQLTPAPTLHAGQHAVGGADPLAPSDIGAVPTGDSSIHLPGDLIYSAAAIRAGAVQCDGAAYPRTGIYAALFAAIGTTYGAGDGSTTFNVPDFTGSAVIGAGPKNGASPNTTARTTRSRAQVGGEETHAITVSEMASHSHTDAGHDHAGGNWGGNQVAFIIIDNQPGLYVTTSAAPGSVGVTSSFATWTGFADLENTGGGGGHNTMQPWGAANIFIKL